MQGPFFENYCYMCKEQFQLTTPPKTIWSTCNALEIGSEGARLQFRSKGLQSCLKFYVVFFSPFKNCFLPNPRRLVHHPTLTLDIPNAGSDVKRPMDAIYSLRVQNIVAQRMRKSALRPTFLSFVPISQVPAVHCYKGAFLWNVPSPRRLLIRIS